MYVRPRPRFRPRNAGGVPFSPALLFTSGVAGAWYDPSDVLLNWRTNLLTWSQEFDNAIWVKTTQGVGAAPVVTANAAVAPDGTTTAETVFFNSVGTAIADRSILRQTVAVSANTEFSSSVWMRSATPCVIAVTPNLSGTGAGAISGNLSASVTSTWQRFEVASTSGATGGNFILDIRNNGNDQVTATVEIWGAQLELGSTATTYQAITTPEQTYLLYDPQPVLYQDSAGTTPVTAVEQPVGLMLDKSQGGLGSELVTNGGFSSSSNWTLSSTTITGGNLVFGVAFGYASQAISGTAGTYKLLVNKSVGFAGAGNLTFAFYNAGSIVGSAISIGSATLTFGSGIITASGSFDEIRIVCSTTDAYQVDSVSVARAPGNHASQATAASRPVLRARYNLLTYSEDFSNAAWSKTGITVGAAVTPPSGTSAAYEITSSATSIMRQTPTVLASNHIAQIYAKKKPGATDWVLLQVSESGLAKRFWFNVGNGTLGTKTGTGTHSISDAGNGWYRCIVAFATSAGTCLFDIEPVTADGGNTGDSAYIGGTDLRTGSSAGTYQRIAAATDYATAGFLPYLAGDGVDDNMVIPTTAISGATAITELHGAWRPTGFAAGNGVIFGGIGTGLTNDHEPFSDNFLYYGFASTARQDFGSLGTVTTPYILDATQTGTTLAAFKNNAQLSTTKTVALGIGTTPRLFVSNNATLQYYTGNLFGGVLIQKVLSASEMASLRSWMAAKSGVTL